MTGKSTYSRDDIIQVTAYVPPLSARDMNAAAEGRFSRQNLKRLREALGLTQKEFAAGIHASMRVIQDQETGKTPFRPIYVLAAERLIDEVREAHREYPDP